MSEKPDATPMGWVLLDADDVIIGAVVGADPSFLLPLREGDRLRVFHQPVRIGAKFVEGVDR